MFEDYFNMEQIYWFLTRAAGLMTWLCACGSIFVGLLMGSKMFGKRPGQPWLLDLHRYLSAMALIFLAGHLFTLWADSFIEFGPQEIFVPGTVSPSIPGSNTPAYSTLGITLGVMSGWLMLVVQVTSIFKDYFPHRFWHAIHLTSFIVVFMGAYHGFDTGSEADNILVISIGAAILAAIVLGTIARVIGSRQAKKYKQYRNEILNTAKQTALQDTVSEQGDFFRR